MSNGEPRGWLDQLEAAPEQIRRSAEGKEGLLDSSPAPGEWSPAEVLAHIRSCGEVWGGYIHRILEEDRPTIRVVNPRTWILATDYMSQPFHEALESFHDQRAELVSTLRTLQGRHWLRTAEVVGAGKPMSKSVHDYVERMARHERSHVRQIARMLQG